MDDEFLELHDSPFHTELLGNVNGLIEQLEDLLGHLDNKEDGTNGTLTTSHMWEEASGQFSLVVGGLQAFLTGLHLEQSKLGREADELDAQTTLLETERDELMEKSHELHCRIQYNALEMKLDQSFSSIEKCSSTDSAKCFKEEAEENLRRTKEITRIANLRKYQLDKDIFNEMEQITLLFQNYERERETYVKEIDLFDDVRKRKISNWLNDPRTEEERELGENVIALLDLSARRRNLEPKVISNILRMHSFKESLNFDRQDNQKRMEEMASLQKRVDSMSGHNHILPKAAVALTDLSGQKDASSHQPPTTNNDDAYSDFMEWQDHHVTPGKALHRCPRKINLATDPVTDPDLLIQLETALRWEINDGQISSAAAADPPTEGATTVSGDLQDPASSSGQSGTPSVHEDAGSVTSLCGDAVSQAKLTDEQTAAAISSPMMTVPRSSHPILHEIESVTALQRSPGQDQLMFGKVKRKSSGGPSSMTAINGDREFKSPSQRLLADERETRSQGSGPPGRAGSSSGTSNCNPRNSRDKII